MSVSGVADLPLHTGGVPRWLWARMVKLAREVCAVVVSEYGRRELLRRLSDPFWFQALGCVLGFDWHSSGLTTVVTAALRSALGSGELGVVVCGGKGKAARCTPEDIERAGLRFSWSTSRVEELKRVSRLVAKVDSAALQDGFELYHHAMVVTEDGDWAVVQQGMCPNLRVARRYHWSSESARSMVEEPHSSIVSDVVQKVVLDLTARASREARAACLDLVREGARRVRAQYASVRELLRGTAPLTAWISGDEVARVRANVSVKYLRMPEELNWEALERAYELEPRRFEDLLLVRGLGPRTLRGLALVSLLIYGAEVSWRDPAVYALAFGGKDGVPFPVDVRAMDEAISFLGEVVRALEVGEAEKAKALRRLGLLASQVGRVE